MRRLVLICMMLLLPLEWTWAAAAGYCGHEAGAAAQHLGHHEHKHQGDAADKGGKAAAKAAVDSDCGACHLSGLQWLDSPRLTVLAVRTSPPLVEQGPLYRSFVPAGPERPDRPRIA